MARSVNADDNWGERAAKLLPAEATAMFVTINGFVSSSSENLTTRSYAIIVTLIVVTICVPVFLIKAYRVDNIRQIALCTASFPLWASNISPKYIAEVLDVNADSMQLLVSIGTVFIAALGPLFVSKPPSAISSPTIQPGE